MGKRPELKVGQIIYIESVGWLNKEPREPKPYEITKINTKSIYAKSVDGNHEQRFDKKTWIGNSSLATDYIWLSPEDYWNSIKRSEDKKVLRSRIASELSNLSLEQLKDVAKMLNIKFR